MKDTTKAAEKLALMKSEFVRTMEKDAPMLGSLTKNLYRLAMRVIATLPDDRIKSVYGSALVYGDRALPEIYVATIPREETLCCTIHILSGEEERAVNTPVGALSNFREWQSMWALFNAMGIKLEAIGFNILDDSVALWTSSGIWEESEELYKSAFGKHYLGITPLSIRISKEFFCDDDNEDD